MKYIIIFAIFAISNTFSYISSDRTSTDDIEISRKNEYLSLMNDIHNTSCMKGVNNKFCDLIRNHTLKYFDTFYYDPVKCKHLNERDIIIFYCTEFTDYITDDLKNEYYENEICYQFRETIILKRKITKNFNKLFYTNGLKILCVYLFITCGIPLIKYLLYGF
mgnify:CR=1 FL=1